MLLSAVDDLHAVTYWRIAKAADVGEEGVMFRISTT